MKKNNLLQKLVINEKAFTLYEILAALTILAITFTLVIPFFINTRRNAALNLLETNQKVLYNIVTQYNILDYTPQVGDAGIIRNELRDIMNESLNQIKNPSNQCIEIISSTQAGSSDCAAIVVAQNNHANGMDWLLENPSTRLWPLRSSDSESSKNKFIGSIIITICNDGYIIFAYPEYNKIHNPLKYYYSN